MSAPESRKRKRMGNRLGKCDVCRSTDAIYTCPRCETVTCSLNCVKKHKKDLDCDGVRVRTKYVPVEKMNENNLLSDYRLLEDIRRCVEEAEWQRQSLEQPQQAVAELVDANNDASEQNQDIQTKCDKKQHSLSKEEWKKVRKAKLLEAVTLGGRKKAKTMEALTKAAHCRGTALTCLPEKFEKHWENTSFFLPNEDCIYWHLKVSFINANFYTLSLNECAETMTLANLVKGCLRRSEEYWKTLAKDDPLLIYRIVDFSKISVLMAADNLPNSQRKFYILDMSQTLRENFVGKCIVEFPQLCIALEDCHVVSSVQENITCNFFTGTSMEGDDEDKPENEFEIFLKKRAAKKKTRQQNPGKKVERDVGVCERESGELTDSSSTDSSFGDTDSEDSEPEAFEQCEFRSVYKNLLNTFDADVNQIHKNK